VVQQNSFKPATDTLSPVWPETEENNPKTGSSAIDNMQYVYWFHDFILRLLGTFAKLWKVTVSFVMSVIQSKWNSAPTGRIFMKFDISVFFENLSQKFIGN
jgi:hypothetical protein